MMNKSDNYQMAISFYREKELSALAAGNYVKSTNTHKRKLPAP